MALRDYSELDEDDYYGQGFDCEGSVSVWVGLSEASSEDADVDVLQDLCGVGYYDLDYQESNCENFSSVSVAQLLRGISYSSTFAHLAIQAAANAGIQNARWLVVQYDFAYDPQRVKREIHKDPVFLGIFPYSRGE